MDFLFFLNDTATTEIYTLSLHDALPIYGHGEPAEWSPHRGRQRLDPVPRLQRDVAGGQRRLGLADAGGCARRNSDLHIQDRKSTRLNSSHLVISYAVVCLKNKNKRLVGH